MTLPDDVAYICRDCALEAGGTWRHKNIATWHNGVCDQCGGNKPVCHVDDWVWPDDERLVTWD